MTLIHHLAIAGLQIIGLWVVLIGLVSLFVGGVLNEDQREWERKNSFQQATVRGTARAHNPEKRGATPRPATNFSDGGLRPPLADTKASPPLMVADPASGGSEISPALLIEPQDLIDEPLCPWCEQENHPQPKIVRTKATHGICRRHAEMMVAQSKTFGKSEYA